MAKMTVELIKKLYISGKAVYEKEQDLEKAVSNILIEFPGLISESSAKFYIGLVKELLLGKGSTWNQNSDLLVYYVENIYLDYGRAMANNAYNGAIKFAYSKSRAPLIEQLNNLKIKYGFSENIPSYDKLWWPSLDEYDPNLSKEDWIKYLTEIEIPNYPSPMKMLKGMLELGGEASCKQLSETYGSHPTTYIGCAMNMGYRVRQYFDLPECMDGEQKRYFAFPFLGRKDSVSGNYIYKIRPELVEALNEIDLTNIDPDYVSKERLGKFDSWEITDEKTAIKHCDPSFFKYNSSGVPKGICWFFEAEDLNKGESKEVYLFYNSVKYIGKITNDSTDRRRIQISWNSDLGKLFKAFEQSDCYAVFNRIDANTYFVNIQGGEKGMTIKETIAHIKSYISSKGFTYEDDLIENFYLSLKSKPFVILAGTSGTGKTRLVKLFAEAIDAKMELVPVRPDWSDSSDLFGHNDIAGNFHPGAIIDFIKDATDNKDKPHILCLDEMNLARVEYYLSDFLSIIETRDINDLGEIVSDPLIKSSYFKQESALEKYGQLYLPENLYVVGTVNMDETTFPFSKKVLDRANTIEFSFVNLISKPSTETEPVKQNLNNQFLKTEYLYLKDCDDEDLIDEVCVNLEEINQILVKANLHIGYRVRDEICFYLLNNKKAELLDENSAFDNEIMQKILPRIQGSSTSIKTVLCELFIKCAGDYTSASGLAVYEQMSSYVETRECRYPNSARKISFMMRRFEEDGFTSYWL